MKTRLSILFIINALSITSLCANPFTVNDTLLNDTFDTPIAERWDTIRPFGGSSVTQANGNVTTVSRGILATTQAFEVPYVISGAFTMLWGAEHFNIALRTDLIEVGQYGERSGIIVTFVNDGNGICIHQYCSPIENWRQLATTGGNGFNLEANRSYAFEIVDTGSSVSVAVDGVNVLSAATSWGTGNRIALYSREMGAGTRIESIKVESITVPDGASTLVCLLLAAVSALIVRRQLVSPAS